MMQNSIQEIRNRLLFLLMRAFVIALLLSLATLLAVFVYAVASPGAPSTDQEGSPENLFIGYYLGHGSWDGVESVLALNNDFNSEPFLLVDENNRIILNQLPDYATEPGSTYVSASGDIVIDLALDGKKVGALITPSEALFDRFIGVGIILLPVGIISFILALFMIVAALLLIRRFVDPLADLIFAAREVTQGKLNTRIATNKGPQDLRTLSESFNEMASSLERNDRERREMLADVAHELRTPLSVIRGRLEGIVDGIYSENASQVSLALEHTYVLERLIDDLRLLTLAEARQLPFDRRQVNVADVIEQVIALFSAEAQEKNISLSFSEKYGSLSAYIDPQRFEQMMSNLIGNALRYIDEGSKVWVTANETSDGLRITVNDNGKGIPPEDLPFIFDRFWRKDKSRSRASGGTGLGLAIAKQLVEAQGGTIEARNLPEGGLQVFVIFPR